MLKNFNADCQIISLAIAEWYWLCDWVHLQPIPHIFTSLGYGKLGNVETYGIDSAVD